MRTRRWYGDRPPPARWRAVVCATVFQPCEVWRWILSTDPSEAGVMLPEKRTRWPRLTWWRFTWMVTFSLTRSVTIDETTPGFDGIWARSCVLVVTFGNAMANVP